MRAQRNPRPRDPMQSTAIPRSARFALAIFCVMATLAGVFSQSSCASTPTPRERAAAAIEKLRTICSDVIADPLRREEALVLVNEMQRTGARMADQVQLSAERFWHVNARYDATRADLAPIIDELRKERRAALLGFMQLRVSLRGSMTDEERAEFGKQVTQAFGLASKGDD